MPADDQNDSFLTVFLRYRKRLEAFVSRRVGSAWAADIVQDLFIRLWDRPIERPDAMAPYLFRAAHNLAIDHIRAEQVRARRSAAIAEEITREVLSWDRSYARDEFEVLAEALRSLPKRTRQAFLLSRMYGRSYAEIARVFGVSPHTVRKEMMRALAACRTALEKSSGRGDRNSRRDTCI